VYGASSFSMRRRRSPSSLWIIQPMLGTWRIFSFCDQISWYAGRVGAGTAAGVVSSVTDIARAVYSTTLLC
jgi:hypothetical protein